MKRARKIQLEASTEIRRNFELSSSRFIATYSNKRIPVPPSIENKILNIVSVFIKKTGQSYFYNLTFSIPFLSDIINGFRFKNKSPIRLRPAAYRF
jgi:hypothetical protein